MRKRLTTDYTVEMRVPSSSRIKSRVAGRTALSNSEKRHINRALTLANLGTMRQKHGAVIVSGGRVVSVGINTYRNDPRHAVPSDALSVHAELAAIKALGIGADFRGMTMYVARINSAGKAMLSRPCTECWSRLTRLGFKEVIHT